MVHCRCLGLLVEDLLGLHVYGGHCAPRLGSEEISSGLGVFSFPSVHPTTVRG